MPAPKRKSPAQLQAQVVAWNKANRTGTPVADESAAATVSL